MMRRLITIIATGALLAAPALLPDIDITARVAWRPAPGFAEADELCIMSGTSYVPDYRPVGVTPNYRPSDYTPCQRER